jgi:hypothetical protein
MALDGLESRTVVKVGFLESSRAQYQAFLTAFVAKDSVNVKDTPNTCLVVGVSLRE